MSLNGDKLLCSLYMVSYINTKLDIYGNHGMSNHGMSMNLSRLDIYSNGNLILIPHFVRRPLSVDDLFKRNSFDNESKTYYKSTITKEDLNIILSLCNILPTDLKQLSSINPNIYYEYRNQLIEIEWPNHIPEYRFNKNYKVNCNSYSLRDIINQIYQIKNNPTLQLSIKNVDKLLCSLYIKKNMFGSHGPQLDTLNIYSNGILILTQLRPSFVNSAKPIYYKSTITEKHLAVILKLCDSDILPTDLKQCSHNINRNYPFIYYEHKNQPI